MKSCIPITNIYMAIIKYQTLSNKNLLKNLKLSVNATYLLTCLFFTFSIFLNCQPYKPGRVQ